jgi:hypothetical protein
MQGNFLKLIYRTDGDRMALIHKEPVMFRERVCQLKFSKTQPLLATSGMNGHLYSLKKATI